MDFGRAAYLRLEELENTVANRARQRIRNAGFRVTPGFELRAQNSYRITTADGNGMQNVLVKLTVRVQAIGRINLRIAGEKGGFIDCNSLGETEQVMLLSCRFTNPSLLTLQAENGFMGTIMALELMLVGDNAHLARRSGDFAADESGIFVGVLQSKNEQLFITRYRLDGTQSATVFTIGQGSLADMCADGAGGFFVVFRDNSSNIWLSHTFADGGNIRMHLGTLPITSIAVTPFADDIGIAFVQDGKVFTCIASVLNNSHTAPVELEGERAESVAFVKNATNPMLLLTRSGRIFARTTDASYSRLGKAQNMTASTSITHTPL